MTSETQKPQKADPAAYAQEQAELRLLVQSVAEGDHAALKQLYDKCSLPLYRTLMRMLRVESSAQDALQDVFLKIWQRADQYDSRVADPIKWMNRIARNQAIDTLRSQRIRVDLDLAAGDDILGNLADHSVDLQTDNENQSVLVHCLQQLQPKPRLCVVRAYCEGYSQEELSEQTGAPIGTVKSWIRRSLIALKECLDRADE